MTKGQRVPINIVTAEEHKKILLSSSPPSLDKIKKLLEMQKKFIELDREGIDPKDYFAPESDESDLAKHRSEYMNLAMEIVDDAHEEKGSKK